MSTTSEIQSAVSTDIESTSVHEAVPKKRLLDEFRTRNVKLLFGVLFALAFAEAVLAVLGEPISGDLAFDAGFVAGFLVVGGLFAILEAGILTVIAKAIYLVARRVQRAL